MNNLNSFKEGLFSVNEDNFEENALKLFRYQAKNNLIYRDYVSKLNIAVEDILEIQDIPFLPIEFFKTQEIKTGRWSAQAIFESSGTTGEVTSKHFIEDIAFSHQVARAIFQQYYGAITDYVILGLLPSYLERENASLVNMVRDFIKLSGSDDSNFYLKDIGKLHQVIHSPVLDNRKILLIGVTFALLDLTEQYDFSKTNNFTVMETGGMKGRRKEIIRADLHQQLKSAFKVDAIHAEYGMTELTSQAYSNKDGKFFTPPWMKILIRDINDPFTFIGHGRIGSINIIDLANAHSCAFIETKDLGKTNEDSGFEILGRMDNADIRGCNLMIT